MSFGFDDFRDQAHRLLRESWKTPQSLAQELYAMLLPGVQQPEKAQPAEVKSKPELPSPTSETTREIVQTGSPIVSKRQAAPRPADPWTTPKPYSGSSWVKPTPIEKAQPEYPVRIQKDTTPFMVSGADAGFIRPAVMPAPSPLIIGQAPAPGFDPYMTRAYLGGVDTAPGIGPFIPLSLTTRNDPDWDFPVDIPVVPPQKTSGTTAYLGKIISGSGDTYSVALYPNGVNGTVGKTVAVNVPQIDPSDDIPNNTWIAPVLQVTNDQSGETEYLYQPPIWLS